MQKYLPTLLSLLSLAGTASSHAMQVWLSSHPIVYALVATASVIVAHWLPSPSQSAPASK